MAAQYIETGQPYLRISGNESLSVMIVFNTKPLNVIAIYNVVVVFGYSVDD